MRQQKPYEPSRKLRQPDATRRVIAKRFGLSEADAARLVGDSIDALVQSAAAIASQRRQPTEPNVRHEGGQHVSDQYSSGVELDGITSARDLLHDALAARSKRDPETTHMFRRVAENTVAQRERNPEPEMPAPAQQNDDYADDLRRRIALEYRLGDALGGMSYERQRRIDRLEREAHNPNTDGDAA